MILRKTYQIDKWTRWDSIVDQAAKDFYLRTKVWPNLLLASELTLGRIDFMANQKKKNIEGGAPADEFCGLGGFKGPGYRLDLCIDEWVPYSSFSLIYDSNPDGDDGEPVPQVDNVPSATAGTRKSRRRKKKVA